MALMTAIHKRLVVLTTLTVQSVAQHSRLDINTFQLVFVQKMQLFSNHMLKEK